MTRRNLIRESKTGFSLLEILVTMALIAVLTTLAVPCWGMIARSRSKQAATTLVMESLERARISAITNKNEVWVIFQHTGGSSQDSLRILSRKGEVITPLDRWEPLPEGIYFYPEKNLMKERPPEKMLLSALNGHPPDQSASFGSMMFQGSGRVGIPLPGGTPLLLELGSTATPVSESIIFSRATGRATRQ